MICLLGFNIYLLGEPFFGIFFTLVQKQRLTFQIKAKSNNAEKKKKTLIRGMKSSFKEETEP